MLAANRLHGPSIWPSRHLPEVRSEHRGAIWPDSFGRYIPLHSDVVLPFGVVSPGVECRVGAFPVRQILHPFIPKAHIGPRRKVATGQFAERENARSEIVGDAQTAPTQPAIGCAQHVVVHDAEPLSRTGLPGGQCEGLGCWIGPFHVWKHLRVTKTVSE